MIVWSIGSVRGVSVVNMWRVRVPRSRCVSMRNVYFLANVLLG